MTAVSRKATFQMKRDVCVEKRHEKKKSPYLENGTAKMKGKTDKRWSYSVFCCERFQLQLTFLHTTISQLGTEFLLMTWKRPEEKTLKSWQFKKVK